MELSGCGGTTVNRYIFAIIYEITPNTNQAFVRCVGLDAFKVHKLINFVKHSIK